MEVEIEILKDIPVEQINRFEDRTIYNVAVFTREFTKSKSAYPYLSGELQRQEVSLPIEGSNKEYGLGRGVEYASRVYNYGQNTQWTNPNTEPQWYHTVFSKNYSTIVNQAVSIALKEV